MIKRFYLRVLTVVWLLLPVWTFAQPSSGGPAAGSYTPMALVVRTGTNITFWQITSRIIAYLAGSIGAISLAMFVVGALMITLSGVKEDYRQWGKDLMIGGILALAVVLGAYALLRTVDYFLSL